MRNISKAGSGRGLVWSALLSIAMVASTGSGQPVHRAPVGLALESAWKWASMVTKEQDLEDVWVGYSIRRMMKTDSWIGSINTWSSSRETTLVELLTGKYLEYDTRRSGTTDLKNEARRAPDRVGGTKQDDVLVEKEVAFLFRCSGAPDATDGLRKVRMSNTDLHVDLDQRPIIWLGSFDQEQSIGFLDNLFRRTGTATVQERLVPAIGVHDRTNAAYRLLQEIVEGSYDVGVREDAVFWISQQRSTEALICLLGLAETSREEKIVERAVFGISQIEGESATDALIRLGKKRGSEKVRKRAVFWLGQRASTKAVESLKEFAYSDENTDVQKQAVFALAHIDDGGGVEEMIQIAKTHPNPKVRKQAVFWLGESDDPRAFDAIVAIAKGK